MRQFLAKGEIWKPATWSPLRNSIFPVLLSCLGDGEFGVSLQRFESSVVDLVGSSFEQDDSNIVTTVA